MLDIEKTCRNCGKVFKPYYGRQIYCCEACHLAVERTKRREQRNLKSSQKIVDQNGQLLSNKTHLSISHAAYSLMSAVPLYIKEWLYETLSSRYSRILQSSKWNQSHYPINPPLSQSKQSWTQWESTSSTKTD